MTIFTKPRRDLQSEPAPAAAPTVPPKRWRPASVALFLTIWLALGFALGTSTLLGPVRWIATLCRASGWDGSVESRLVMIVVALLVAGSAAASAWLTRIVLRSPRMEARLGIPLLTYASAAGALWLWLNPALLQMSMGETEQAGTAFTFGPYPTAERMVELKREGYTAIVSLLHTAVIPFEPKLLGEERTAAQLAGIELIHAPLLPWVSDNKDSLETIKAIAKNPRGRYYVHCYLGKDRTLLVRRIVEQTSGIATATVNEVRTLDGRASFERGAIHPLGTGNYLTPYPTGNEFICYVLGGTVRGVISLLDPASPPDRERIEEERALLAHYELPFENIPLSHAEYDPAQVLEVARAVRSRGGSLLVHHFFSPGGPKGILPEAFLQAYRSDLPPIPPSSFLEPLDRGAVRVIAPNVAAGPRPLRSEFRGRLFPAGIRAIGHLGDPGGAEARGDRNDARGAGIEWRSFEAREEALAAAIAAGGPWYLYGPGLASVEDGIASALGPAIPPAPTIGSRASRPSDGGDDPESSARAGGSQAPPHAASTAGVALGLPGSNTTGATEAALAPARGSSTARSAAAALTAPHGSSPPDFRANGGAGGPAGVDQPPATPEPEPGGLARGPRRSLGEFLADLVPGLRTSILLAPILLLAAALAGAFAGWLRIERGVRTPFTRKVFHFSIFSLASLLQIVGGLSSVGLFGALVSGLVVYAILRGDGFPMYEALARPTDAPRRTLFIVIPLVTTALGGLVANLLFGPFAIIGYLVGGWGDAVGEPVGSAWGRTRYRVPSMGGVPAVRTLEGSAAVTLVGSAAAVLGLLATGSGAGTALGVGLACGLAGSLVEAVSHHGLDNLTIQIAAAGTACWFLS